MKRAAAVLLVIMATTSCADPQPPASGEPAEAEPASITVSATYDQSTCCYIEGFIPFVRIESSGVDVKKKFEFPDDGGAAEVVLEVPQGGENTLESWVEPCSANCGEPRDPPTDHCSAIVAVPDGDDVRVDLTIRSAQPCELSVEGQ
jgi:hypothetical protein